MADMQFGLMLRAQFPPARIAGHFASWWAGEAGQQAGLCRLTNGIITAAAWQGFQQFPFLSA